MNKQKKSLIPIIILLAGVVIALVAIANRRMKIEKYLSSHPEISSEK